MSRITGLAHRLRVLVDPDGYAREVEREIRFHLDREAMHKRSSGLSDADAQYAARSQFGNVTYVREEVRRMTGIGWLDRLRQNFTYAARGLRQSPGFTIAVVLTLGLGLGVNSAMFTFLDSVFVKPPAGVVNPEQIRRMYAGYARKDEPNGRLYSERLFHPQIQAIRRAIDSSIVLGIYGYGGADSVAVTVGSATSPTQRGYANSDYFRALGVRLQRGRFFDADENLITNPASVAVISDAMWKREFKGDPGVVGSTFNIKYRPVTVIGVTAEGFRGIDLGRTDFWMPIGNAGSGQVTGLPWYDSFDGDFGVLARFPNAASEARFLGIASRVAPPVKIPFWGDSTAEIRSGPIQKTLGPTRAGKEVAISIRLGGVGLIILLITLANVSNLLLVRATRREREIAIRRALGVTRARLFEQLVTESVLLALVGGVVALVLALWVGLALRGLLMPEVKWAAGVLDPRVGVFAGVAALIAGIVVGLVPAIHSWRPDLLSSLRAGGKSGAYRRSHLRTGLLVAQAALSLVLLVGSGLFVRSLNNIQRIDLGFDFDRLMMSRVRADTGAVTNEVVAAMPQILERVAAIPGVLSVAATSSGPMLGASYPAIFLPGRDSVPPALGSPRPAMKVVTPGYFRTVGQRIVAGREFIEGDPRSVIVSEAMAKVYWPGESALGKCLIIRQRMNPCLPVVGVAVETHRMVLVHDKKEPQYYANDPDRTDETKMPYLLVRAERRDQARVAAMASAEIKALVPRAALAQLRPMEVIQESLLRPWKLGAKLFTAMGILALIVAAIGVYSVIAYATSQRTNEMGIRIALGAKLSDITRLVVGDGLRTVAIGIVVGIALALAAGKLVASLLYDVSPRDPVIMASGAIIFAVIGIAACVIPALRAAKVDPVSALRVD
jgi:putative ABC transport system permease protein